MYWAIFTLLWNFILTVGNTILKIYFLKLQTAGARLFQHCHFANETSPRLFTKLDCRFDIFLRSHVMHQPIRYLHAVYWYSFKTAHTDLRHVVQYTLLWAQWLTRKIKLNAARHTLLGYRTKCPRYCDNNSASYRNKSARL